MPADDSPRIPSPAWEACAALVGSLAEELAAAAGDQERTVSALGDAFARLAQGEEAAGVEALTGLQRFDELRQRLAIVVEGLRVVAVGAAAASVGDEGKIGAAPAALLEAVTLSAMKARLAARLGVADDGDGVAGDEVELF